MQKKYRLLLIVSIIGLLAVLSTGTYAYLRKTSTQTNYNQITTLSCLDIDLDNITNGINLINDYPISDTEGVTRTPYTFTITNNCSSYVLAQINLESLALQSNQLSRDYVRSSINIVGDDPEVVALNSSTNTTATITNAQSNELIKIIIEPNDSEDLELRVWVAQSTTNSQGMNKNYEGKVVVLATAIQETTEPDGWTTARTGTLLAGIRDNQVSNHATYTVPGRALITGDEGLRATEDDYGTSYYYRGAVENNYVSFAGMCWRIVRITGDGSIKLTLYNYNPTGAETPCDASLDGPNNALARLSGDASLQNTESNYTSIFNTGIWGYNTGVGFMYSNNPTSNDYLTAHANDNDSRILTFLKGWYDRVFTSTQKEQLADIIWCNDKRIITDTTYNPFNYSNVLGTGVGTDITYYQAVKRIYPKNTAQPSLKCGDSKTDNLISKFTASTSTDGGYGNGALNGYKIGLLTADELAFAGITFQDSTPSYYIYKNDYQNGKFWTLSPAALANFTGFATANEIYLNEGVGLIVNMNVNINLGVRPAIALKSNVTISSGVGTQASPFVVN